MSTTKKQEVGVAVPLPPSKHEEKRLVQAEISKALFNAVEAELRARKITIKAVVEYGLSAWLSQVNPAEAKRLGVAK